MFSMKLLVTQALRLPPPHPSTPNHLKPNKPSSQLPLSLPANQSIPRALPRVERPIIAALRHVAPSFLLADDQQFSQHLLLRAHGYVMR